eukprot:3053824-Rhodomonas_salina.3
MHQYVALHSSTKAETRSRGLVLAAGRMLLPLGNSVYKCSNHFQLLFIIGICRTVPGEGGLCRYVTALGRHSTSTSRHLTPGTRVPGYPGTRIPATTVCGYPGTTTHVPDH